jgi:hypothetical protein
MKKFFLLIPAMLLTLAINAAVININTETEDAIRLALNSANDGDIIEMDAGTYVESNINYIAFTGKHVTVKAADGENVIIQPKVPVTIAEGGCAHFENVKFDVSKLTELADWYEHLIYPTDANASNSMILEGCEFYGFSLNKSLLFCGSSNRLASVTINNCYFHNIMKSCLFIESTEAINISISNSTFADIETNTSSYDAGVIDSRATSGTFRVDHCTFYNVLAKNTDFAAIGKIKTSDAIVSNCIFSMPTSTADLRAIRDVAQANNCLTYNYTKDDNWGIHGDVTKNNCIQLHDPLFTDAANGDFSFNKTSPAYYTGTAWSHIGDPRWFPAESEGIDLPATSADESVTLNSANIEAKHPAVTCDGDGLYDLTYASDIRWMAWIVNINPLVYDISAFVSCTTGWHPDLYLFDLTTGAEIASRAEEYHDPTEGASFNLGEWDLTSVEAGKYLLVVKNNYSGSHLKLKSLILSYVGGAVQNISTAANTTLNVADALFTDGFTRTDGQVSPGSWKPAEPNPLGYVKWNIATSETKFYDLTLNFSSTNGHSMKVNIYEDEEASPVATVSESFTETTGTLTLTDRVNLVGGKNYIVKVTNPTSGSQAKVTSVVFAPVVATATELPGTLAFSNAVLSEKANITDGMLYFNEPGADKDPRGQWAQWEVTTDHDGLFLFTMGVTSSNGQNYKITIKDDGDNELDYYETSLDSGDKTLTHYFALNTGSYFVKVENTRSFSKGHLTSLVVTEPAGVVTLDEAATSTDSWADKVGETTYDVQIIRTIKAGMYNTLCLPFAVSSSQCKDIFGSDVQIRTLEEATVEEGDFVLNLNFKVVHDIYQGTPVLIKTSRDIVNPVFAGVKFATADPDGTYKTNADFVGNFVAGTIPASENNLFLGANNTLYFPTVDMPILGMRAYFVIHDAPAGAVRRARIIEREQIITDVELVAEQPSAKSQKILRNGQLIIIRDGIRYNALGIKLQ